jgi:hypothetical protein
MTDDDHITWLSLLPIERVVQLNCRLRTRLAEMKQNAAIVAAVVGRSCLTIEACVTELLCGVGDFERLLAFLGKHKGAPSDRDHLLLLREHVVDLMFTILTHDNDQIRDFVERAERLRYGAGRREDLKTTKIRYARELVKKAIDSVKRFAGDSTVPDIAAGALIVQLERLDSRFGVLARDRVAAELVAVSTNRSSTGNAGRGVKTERFMTAELMATVNAFDLDNVEDALSKVDEASKNRRRVASES